MTTSRLVLLRHGQSVWNARGRFTGWADVELTERGRAEARAAGAALAACGLRFDACFCSRLRRAVETAQIVLAEMGQGALPVRESWRLNERHCGALEGLSWWQAAGRYGPLRLVRWRRDCNERPPRLSLDDARFPGRDPRYAALASIAELPRGESLNDTRDRLRPCWNEEIAPLLRRGAAVLVVSHRNALRALLRVLGEQSGADVRREKIRTGEPMLLEMDRDLRVLSCGGPAGGRRSPN